MRGAGRGEGLQVPKALPLSPPPEGGQARMSLAGRFLTRLLPCTHVGGSLAPCGLGASAGKPVCLTWGQPLIMSLRWDLWGWSGGRGRTYRFSRDCPAGG